MKEKLIINSDRCKSCGLCILACQKDALSIGKEANPAGYMYITVDHEKCVCCGMCYTACPDYVFTIEEVGA
ncbi:MAG: 4Fe-4S binding protein [Firmicutes bacterium]|nr:4Fe-4S binding protein [Bacillota bacterium]